MELIERISKGKVRFILHVMLGMISLPLMQSEIIIYSLVRFVFEALIFLLDNIYVRFGSKLSRQIVGIPKVLPVPLL